MTTAIPKDLLIEEYIHKPVRVLVNDGGDEDIALEGALVGVTTAPDGTVCLTLADSRNKADPDFTFINGEDVVRIEVIGQLGPVVVYANDPPAEEVYLIVPEGDAPDGSFDADDLTDDDRHDPAGNAIIRQGRRQGLLPGPSADEEGLQTKTLSNPVDTDEYADRLEQLGGSEFDSASTADEKAYLASQIPEADADRAALVAAQDADVEPEFEEADTYAEPPPISP